MTSSNVVIDVDGFETPMENVHNIGARPLPPSLGLSSSCLKWKYDDSTHQYEIVAKIDSETNETQSKKAMKTT